MARDLESLWLDRHLEGLEFLMELRERLWDLKVATDDMKTADLLFDPLLALADCAADDTANPLNGNAHALGNVAAVAGCECASAHT